MRDHLFAAIYNAIDNAREITVSITNNTASCSFCLVPDHIDVGNVEVIIYSGNSHFSFDPSIITYNDVDDVYVVSGFGAGDEILIAC